MKLNDFEEEEEESVIMYCEDGQEHGFIGWKNSWLEHGIEREQKIGRAHV